MPQTLQLWLGSQHSYEASVEASLKGEARAQARSSHKAGMIDDDEDECPELLSIQGSVGVVTIRGSLVPGNAGWGRYFGNVGYDDIRDALIAAISSENIASIVLDIGSGGGAVEGCLETAQLIARVNKIKPVYTYVGGTMASAALWLGSSARKIYASQTAMVGSLGILMIHVDRSKQLADAGLAVTIIRAGTSKALSNPYEPLTDKAKAEMQSQADSMYTIFLDYVADARGVSSTVADTKFGQGRMFLAAEALTVGLIDSVGSFEDAFGAAAKVKAKAGVVSYTATNNPVIPGTASATAETLAHNPPIQKGTDMPKSLTVEELAAMAAGVTLPAATAQAEKTEAEVAAEAAAALAATEAAATAAAALESAAKPTAATVDATVVMLQGMLATAQEGLVTAKMEAKTASDALALVKSTQDGLLNVVRASIKTMGVHFGVNGEAAAAMSAPEALAEHARLAGLFVAKFKVGGVAAASPEKEASPKAEVNPQFLAVLASAKHAK